MVKVDISRGDLDDVKEKVMEWWAVVESYFYPRCEGESLESLEEQSDLTMVMFSNQQLCI